jgi:hypothetical protein
MLTPALARAKSKGIGFAALYLLHTMSGMQPLDNTQGGGS